MFSNTVLIIIFISSWCAQGLSTGPDIRIQVSVDQGILEGASKITESGFKYEAFLGIPYAAPPIEARRFQDPVSFGKWEGVWNATSYGPSCPRLDNETYVGDEDCLFLNIYVPGTVNQADKLPVMFWIYGGGFIWGDGGPSFYGPDHIVERNVILVTVNYRLGPLGFMSVFNEENSGNMGIKDQLLALKWVTANIEAFGGDAGKITIFGESAGGMSVEMLILSPLSVGLYARAIVQSGPLTVDWLFKDNAEKYAHILGSHLGYNATDSDSDMLSFLKNASAENIIRSAKNMTEELNDELIFSPVVERNSTVNAILDKHPRDLLISGDYSPVNEILYGTVSQEGISPVYIEKFLNMDIDWENADVSTFIQDFQQYIPRELNGVLTDTQREKAARLIEQFYFPNNENVVDNVINLYSDFLFNKNVQFSFKSMSKKAKSAFYYKFSYHGNLNFIQNIINFNYSGAAHGDDLGYLFSGIYSQFGQDPTVSDLLTLNRMVDMWTNFAKYGHPTPELTDILEVSWEAVNETHFNYLDIDSNFTLGVDPFKERMEFWNNLEDLINSAPKSNQYMSASIAVVALILYLW